MVNPQGALPLPPRPSVERYRKLAKELVKACKSGDEDAVGVSGGFIGSRADVQAAESDMAAPPAVVVGDLVRPLGEAGRLDFIPLCILPIIV